MLRLVTFTALLALAVAQNGYDYNRPGKPFSAGKPFSPGTTPTRPGSGPSNGYPSPTSPSFPSSPAEEYPTGGDDNPSFQPSFPSTPNQAQGYPSGRPQQTFPGQTQAPGYQGQTGQAGYPQAGTPQAQTPGYQNQAPTGPSAGYPQTGAPFPTQGQNYPSQNGGQQNYPSQTGGQTGGQNFQGQTGGQNYQGQGVGQNFQGQSGGQNYPGQVGGQNYQGQSGAQNFQGQTGGTSSDDTGAYEGGDYSAIPGEPDRDYPILTEIPETSFRCDAQAYPGYYADVETRCQVFHVCANNRTYDFLCPNGTIFSQEVFVCVWWNQFDCNSAPGLFELNANLYDYSITGSQGNAGASGDFIQGQGQTGAYPGATGPSAAYPGASAPGAYPGAQPSGQAYPSGPQTPTGVYPAPNQGQSYPTSAPQSTFPGAAQGSYTGSQSPSANTGYPDSGSQGPTAAFPGSSASTGFPGSRPSSNQGYPSGRPNGASFPSEKPGQGNGNGFPPKPNREYLPPRN